MKSQIEKVLEDFNNDDSLYEDRLTKATLALLNLFNSAVGEEEECYCNKLKVSVGDIVCPACLRNNLRIQIRQRLGVK